MQILSPTLDLLRWRRWGAGRGGGQRSVLTKPAGDWTWASVLYRRKRAGQMQVRVMLTFMLHLGLLIPIQLHKFYE